MNELLKLHVTFCTIHPIYIELYNTNNSLLRIKRQTLLSKFEFTSLPLVKEDFIAALDIQAWLLQKKIFTASPTDVYLGSKLSSFSHSQILIVTSNISDFPYPLYKREGGIILQNETNSKTVFLLSFNHDELKSIIK